MNNDCFFKIHNDFYDLDLSNLSATQINIFFAICFLYQKKYDSRYRRIDDNKDSTQADIPIMECSLNELIQISQFKKGGPKKFAEEIRAIMNKGKRKDGEDVDFPFFYCLDIDADNKNLSVEVHNKAAYMLLGVDRPYTLLNMNELTEIKSIYAKRTYLLLKRWRTVGLWEAKIGDIRRILSIPDAYKMCDIDKRVLVVIKKELSPFFGNLTIEKKHEKGKGKWVTSIKFTFIKENARTGKNSGIVCPVCGEILIEKEINGNVCWCHADGWKEDAPCKMIFNSIAEIRGYKEKPVEERNENEVNYTGMPEEMREKLNACFE